MILFARLIVFGLVFVLAVTAQHMAVARAVSFDAAGQVVLCTGQGVKTVTVDRNGEPMDLVHICPDCVLSHCTDLPGEFALPGLRQQVSLVHYRPEAKHFMAVRFVQVQARGPPVSV